MLMCPASNDPGSSRHLVSGDEGVGSIPISGLRAKIAYSIHRFDGGALPPKHEPPVYTGPEPTGGPAGAKTYHGSCHCGAVKLALRCKPLDTLDTLNFDKVEERVVECNCSICHRVRCSRRSPHA